MSSDVYLIEWQHVMYCWYVNVMCSYFMKCMDKPSSVPYEWWFHSLRGWVGYVCKHTRWTTLCTLISAFMWHKDTHTFPKDAFISLMHLDLRSFYNILVFEQVMRKEWLVQAEIALKMEWFTYLKMSLNMWWKWRARKMLCWKEDYQLHTRQWGRTGMANLLF